MQRRRDTIFKDWEREGVRSTRHTWFIGGNCRGGRGDWPREEGEKEKGVSYGLVDGVGAVDVAVAVGVIDSQS